MFVLMLQYLNGLEVNVKKPWVFVLLSVVMLGACGKEVRVASQYVPQEQRYAKPGADIALENSQVTLEVSGAQYSVDIGLLSGYSGGDLSLSVKTSDGLYIVGGDVNPTMTLTKGKINCPYTIIAAETGRYYIYLNAKVEEGGKVFTRSLTFIVQVGDDDKSNADTTLEKTGTTVNGVISMPAKEEIIR